MATRSLIGIKDDLNIAWVYCHDDGYPQGVGKELLTNYNSPEAATDLVAGGNMQSLINGPKHYAPHEPAQLWEIDPHCGLPDARQIKDMARIFIDYVYLFDLTVKEWYILKCSDHPATLEPLTE